MIVCNALNAPLINFILLNSLPFSYTIKIAPWKFPVSLEKFGCTLVQQYFLTDKSGSVTEEVFIFPDRTVKVAL